MTNKESKTNKLLERSKLSANRGRMEGSFKPDTAFNADTESGQTKLPTISGVPAAKRTTVITEKNQPAQKKRNNATMRKVSVKIPERTKEELQALKMITDTKFDYAMIQLMLDTYVKNELNDKEKKRFRSFLS